MRLAHRVGTVTVHAGDAVVTIVITDTGHALAAWVCTIGLIGYVVCWLCGVA